MWTMPEAKDMSRTTRTEDEELKLVSEGCAPTTVSISVQVPGTFYGDVINNGIMGKLLIFYV